MQNSSPNHHQPRQTTPANVYYSIPYYEHFLLLYTFVGSFTCAQLSGSMSSTTGAILWTAYVLSCVVFILTYPRLCVERARLDENGNHVTLRRPVIGFRMCEATLDLEGISKGWYDAPDGRTDSRLHDGYRYGYALIRL